MNLEEYRKKIEFTEREMALIENCKVYMDNNPSGMPGHNLAIIVAKLAKQTALQEAVIAMLVMSIGKSKEGEDETGASN